MIWTAWNNGQHHRSGAGYGFKISVMDRDSVFSRDWDTVAILMPSPGGVVAATANIDKQSFWGDCRELISQEIGEWLRGQGHATWQRGAPSRFDVKHLGGARFEVIGPAS
jgi:hypothetical protein